MYIELRMAQLEARIQRLEARLKAMEENRPYGGSSSPREAYDTIEALVCSSTGAELRDMRRKCRLGVVAWSRHMVRGITCELVEIKPSALATLTGYDHGTILHSLRVLKERCETNAKAAAEYAKLKEAAEKLLVNGKEVSASAGVQVGPESSDCHCV